MLFTLPPSTKVANRDSENFFNPEISNLVIKMNKITNKMFAQSLKEDQMWIKAIKLFLNEHRRYDDQSNMTLITFYGTPTSSDYCF